MPKKILVGLLEGGLVGVLVFVALSRLRLEWVPVVAYAATALVGALVGAVAGRPIWAREAKLEALLKSLAGAVIAVTALFGARKWLLGVRVDLEALGVGHGSVGNVPAAILPLVGAFLGFVFQIDDALGSEDKGSGAHVRVAPSQGVERIDEADDEGESSERRARR